MKRILFVCFAMFVGAPLFAQLGWDIRTYPGVPLTIQDASEVWRSEISRRNEDNVSRRIEQGTIVLGGSAAFRGEINGALEDMASIMYEGNQYAIRTGNLRPLGDGRLPESWITMPDRERKWVVLYYLDALSSQDRNTFLKHESSWIDFRLDLLRREYGHNTNWYHYFRINFESLIFLNAVITMGGFDRFSFFITNIAPFNAGYKISMTGDRWFATFRNSSFFTDLPFPLWSERQSLDMIFIPDGDFMDVYLDSLENHFATFAKVDAVILEELERLVQTNVADLSRITSWPRRADGSMDIPPPDGVSLAFRASHRTTDRLRVRDNPSTDANIVTTLDLGAEVQILETGSVSTIDGITAPWIRLLSAEGYTGWSFSGFLETVAVSGGVAEIQPAVVAASIVAPVNIAAESTPATSAMPLWVWLAIGGGAIAVAGGVFAARRKR